MDLPALTTIDRGELLTIGLYLALPLVGALVATLVTRGRRYPGSFVDEVYPDGTFVTASAGRRFVAYGLDGLIQLCTLFVGWVIWLAIVAPRGQSPAKSLLRMYIVDDEGQIASARTVWLREFGFKFLGINAGAFFPPTMATSAISLTLASSCIQHRDKQAPWDIALKTYVAHAPKVEAAVLVRASNRDEALARLAVRRPV